MVRLERGKSKSTPNQEWAVESANGPGYLVSQQLVAAGETVFDVPPALASRVRLIGSGGLQKNDPNDARSVAIASLRSARLAQVTPNAHDRAQPDSDPQLGDPNRNRLRKEALKADRVSSR